MSIQEMATYLNQSITMGTVLKMGEVVGTVIDGLQVMKATVSKKNPKTVFMPPVSREESTLGKRH